MDTTKKYILMCEESKKDINKKEELWDCFYDKEQEHIEVIGSINTDHPMGNNYHKDEIPLYTQDQLQMMVDSSEYLFPIDLIEHFGIIDTYSAYFFYFSRRGG